MTSFPVRRTLQILTAAACGMTCLLALLPAAGHDQMWLLLGAQRLLGGAKLYGPQIFEFNPPLIYWISAIPVMLGSLLNIPSTAAGKLLVCVVAAFAGFVSARLLGTSRLDAGRRVGRSEWWWLLFAFVVVFGVVPARDFGQREHILSLLCLPYVLSAAIAAGGGKIGPWYGCLIGVAAATGIALKPHQVLLPVAVELGILFVADGLPIARRTRLWLRAETVTMFCCGVLYLVCVHRFVPDYFTQVVPVLRDTYWAFGHLGWPGLVKEAPQLHLLILTFAALVAQAGWQRLSASARLLAFAGLGSTIAYYALGTGWYYQQLPAITFFTLAVVLAATDLARRSVRLPAWTPIGAAALSALALFLTAHFMNYPFTPARSFPIDTPDPIFFANLPRGTPVAILTTTVDYSVPPVFRYHLELAQRYPHLWMLPAILRDEDPLNTGFYDVSPSRDRGARSKLGGGGSETDHTIPPTRLAQLDALQHRFMAEDLARWQPRLLLIERCQDSTVQCQVLEDRHDNLLAWFLRDPGFRVQFAHYRYWRSAGPFDGWVRAD